MRIVNSDALDGGGLPGKPAASKPATRPAARPGGIVVAPGARLALLARHLACAGAEVRQVEDLLDLFANTRGTRCIVVDARDLPREDLGLLRRAVQQAGASLVVVADDPRQGLVRELGGLHGARWLPWPPTLDDIATLAQAPSDASDRTIAAVDGGQPPRSAGEFLDGEFLDGQFVGGEFGPVADPGVDGPRSARPSTAPTPRPSPSSSSIWDEGVPASGLSAPLDAGASAPAEREFASLDAELDAIEEILSRGRASPVPGLEMPRPLDLRDDGPVPTARQGSDVAPPTSGGTPLRVPGFPDTVRLPDSMPAELAIGDEKGAPGATPQSTPAKTPPAGPGARLPEGLGGPLSLESETQAGPAPAWMRDQVADLADQATRLDLSLSVLTDSLGDTSEERKHDLETQVEQVRGETARLMGFARTLAFLATPPARGTQRFDVGEVLKVYVAGLAKLGPDAPRLLYRSAGPVEVLSDRGLLGVVFDALLFVARECSSRGVVVRAQVLAPKDGRVAIEIDFPSGPLDGRTVEHIFTPYALRRVLPNLGPNALAAAQAIVAGQGGSLSLGFLDKGRALWRLELPVADA